MVCRLKHGWLLGLIMLTGIDGTPIWVESTQVAIIRLHASGCERGAGAAIKIATTALCVRNTPDDIRKKKADCEVRNDCQ